MLRLTTIAIAAVLLVLSLLGFANERRESTLTGEQVQERIIGTWCNPYPGKTACQSHERFSNDGLIQACVRSDNSLAVTHVVASYSIKGNRVCFKVTESSNRLLPIGDDFCVTVLHLDSKTYRYILDGESSPDEMRRLPSTSPSCPGNDT